VKIEVLAEGEGPAAEESDRVEIHYTLYLADGTRVDSSHDGKPLSFLILEDSALIEGIQHGALGMREKELRRVWVPPRLGYQNRRVGKIPENARLRFDVELMELFPNPY
jgi:FKBP-type peptidyl-prolyl cis-trans isomerase